ncbi:MAG: hypothetical protein HQ521_18805 [Bacteroidetes bacterium]|nr:hypothetical protein [Bacteroidota bacterium]
MLVTYSNIIFARKGERREEGYYFEMGYEQANLIPDEIPFFLSGYYGPFQTHVDAQNEKDELLQTAEDEFNKGMEIPPEWEVFAEYWNPKE